MMKRDTSSFFLLWTIAIITGIANTTSIGLAAEEQAASLRDVEVNENVSLANGQSVEGLGIVTLKEGQVTVRYFTPRSGLPEPTLENYTLASQQRVLDLVFPGTPASKGGTVALTDQTFERISVGQTTKGDLLVRLLVRASEAGQVSGARLVSDVAGVSLLTEVTNGNNTAQESEQIVPPLDDQSVKNGIPRQQQGTTGESNKPLLRGTTLDSQIATDPQVPSQNSLATKTAGTNDAAAASLPTTSSAIPFWQSASVVFAVISALGFGGLALVKLKRNGGIFTRSNEEPLMQVVSTLSLAPKRQIVLVKIRDQEFAMASTESGLQFLTAIGPNDALRTTSYSKATSGVPLGTTPMSFAALSDSTMAANTNHNENAKGSLQKEANQGRVNLLMNAIKEAKSQNAPSSEKTLRPAPAPSPSQQTSATAASPFQKFLTQTFAKEQQRIPAQNAAAKENQEAEIDVDNVTDLIRQKLKQMNQQNTSNQRAS